MTNPASFLTVKAILLLGVTAVATFAAAAAPSLATAPLPQRLSDTGLFEPGSTTAVRAGVLVFSPQYPLWSDGTRKRRWIALPPGASIDATHADAWDFPIGTKLWKEFAYGRRVETRMLERLGAECRRLGLDRVVAAVLAQASTISRSDRDCDPVAWPSRARTVLLMNSMGVLTFDRYDAGDQNSLDRPAGSRTRRQ